MSLYSQFALLVAVTGIGGNFSGTGAGGGPRSPEAAHDPTPGGPHVDTGPSEEEAQLRRGRERKTLLENEQSETYDCFSVLLGLVMFIPAPLLLIHA